MNDADRRRLDEEGYLVLPGLMSPDLLGRLRTRVDELFAEEGEQAGWEVKTETGATRLVPGSHRWGKVPPPGMYDPYPGQQLVLGKAGDVVVMNAHMWHGGTANRTAAPRRAMHVYYTRRDKPQQQWQRKWLSEE